MQTPKERFDFKEMDYCYAYDYYVNGIFICTYKMTEFVYSEIKRGSRFHMGVVVNAVRRIAESKFNIKFQ